jgi:hypothetical protein
MSVRGRLVSCVSTTHHSGLQSRRLRGDLLAVCGTGVLALSVVLSPVHGKLVLWQWRWLLELGLAGLLGLSPYLRLPWASALKRSAPLALGPESDGDGMNDLF